jgi:hypothetical protein
MVQHHAKGNKNLHPKTHRTTSALPGTVGLVAAAAVHLRPHATSGAPVGQTAALLAGAAGGTRTHFVTGDAAGPGSALSATGRDWTHHAAGGLLPGQDGTIAAGAAGGHRTHFIDGELLGPDAVVASPAVHGVYHLTDGVMEGAASEIVGDTIYLFYFEKDVRGDLAGPDAAVTGFAWRQEAEFASHPVSWWRLGGDGHRGKPALWHACGGRLAGQRARIDGLAWIDVRPRLRRMEEELMLLAA